MALFLCIIDITRTTHYIMMFVKNVLAHELKGWKYFRIRRYRFVLNAYILLMFPHKWAILHDAQGVHLLGWRMSKQAFHEALVLYVRVNASVDNISTNTGRRQAESKGRLGFYYIQFYFHEAKLNARLIDRRIVLLGD